ncbi:MAG: hypothetical protein H7210_03540, partial [Pyrinomonadaceae bacterium]|nr:hypothetical protein [Phycisphaerales bacterium]
MHNPLFAAFALILAVVAMPAENPIPMKSSTISGAFDVKMIPSSAPDAAVGRFALDKQYHGEL